MYIDRLIDDIYESLAPLYINKNQAIEHFDDRYELYISAKGLKKKEIKATVENNLLTVTGTPKKDRALTSDLKRAWRLIDSIDTENISLKLEDGILIITLPKKEKAKAMEIAVK